MVPVALVGVYPIGPEGYQCALLECEGSGRYIPVWLSPAGGRELAQRLNGWTPERPSPHEMLAEVISKSTTGLHSIELSSYYQGVFLATVSLNDGQELDATASDALILALLLDATVEADESVLAQSSLRLAAEDAQKYFDLEIAPEEDPSGSAVSDPDAQSFGEFLRSLGVEEDDLRGDGVD
ncbi:hypothetical protein CAPI_05775 [Corynebacterium capitovis DSM 44611]|uniref:bifunctional nuclease domain-containing protein n=1 Tax=Corynebacterium capitovis TaxID=131081 RepID=UPI000379FC4E|nr:bifunctional nuclease domain-containing protein [Corynebacterium capitovis]WKD57705.1 hypothetical protein CAPI_05775 [Corynebacterium capitovis DSM 44611]